MSGMHFFQANTLHILVIYDCIYLVKFCIIKLKDTKKCVLKKFSISISVIHVFIRGKLLIFTHPLEDWCFAGFDPQRDKVRQADKRLICCFFRQPPSANKVHGKYWEYIIRQDVSRWGTWQNTVYTVASFHCPYFKTIKMFYIWRSVGNSS